MNEIQSINEQMGRIANLARAYANASPEQRSNVNREDIQAQLDRYNELKARRNELYAEQEARVQAELEAQRQAQQQAQQWATRGGNKWGSVPNNQDAVTPTAQDIPPHDYSKDQSFIPWMSIDPRFTNNRLPDYDARYDVNSPQYVYNKTNTNWKWQTSTLPEFQDTYWYYDAWGRLIPQEKLNEIQAYQDSLNMPWEKVTWMNTTDLLMSMSPYTNEIVWAVKWLWKIPYVRFNNVNNANNTLKSLPGGTNNYLTQWNNYLTQWNNFLTNQSVWLQRAYWSTPTRVNSWQALERLRS